MSKLSFRARALDPSKPMPIYLAEELPDLPEYSAINRAVPQMPSGMEKEEESEHHLQRAICAGLIIPTPEVFETECEFYERSYPNNYKMPRQMIHMQPLNLEQDIPDYDMDSADESWVNSQSKRLDLSYYKFEQMMDRLERSSGQTVVTLNEAKALLKQDDEVSIAVYDYWLNKRLKTQHPLILAVKTENRGGIAANSPYLAFRRRTEKMQTRKNRKNDEASYEKMLKLRRDLSRAVTLLEMIKKREKTKREQLHLTIEVVEKRYQARDFSGQLQNEYQAQVAKTTARPAFAPLYSNQYSHLTQSPQHQWSASGLNHYGGGVSGLNKRDLDPLNGGIGSSSRKEKRQYKKRKHKHTQREKQRMYSSPGPAESMLSSEEEELCNVQASESEDEGPYGFKRNKNCQYNMPSQNGFGNWPWASKDENGGADPRYRFTLTSLAHPRPRCIGFARRRVGRGGRVIIDRMSTDMDELWSRLDYTIFDSAKQAQRAEEDESSSSCVVSAIEEPQTQKRLLDISLGSSFSSCSLNNNNLRVSRGVGLTVHNNGRVARDRLGVGGDAVDDVIKSEHAAMTSGGGSGTVSNLTSDSGNLSKVLDRHTCGSDSGNVNSSHPATMGGTLNSNQNPNWSRSMDCLSTNGSSVASSGYFSQQSLVGGGLGVTATASLDAVGLEASRFVGGELTRSLSLPLSSARARAFQDVSGSSAVFRSFAEPSLVVAAAPHQLPPSSEWESASVDNEDDMSLAELARKSGGPSNVVRCAQSEDELFAMIRKEWLHFRPKPRDEKAAEMENEDDGLPKISTMASLNLELITLTTGGRGEERKRNQQTADADEAELPSSIFLNSEDNVFQPEPFALDDLECRGSRASSVVSSMAGSPTNVSQMAGAGPGGGCNALDQSLSGDSLNELSLNLGDDETGEDNETVLENILQECQMGDLKILEDPTIFTGLPDTDGEENEDEDAADAKEGTGPKQLKNLFDRAVGYESEFVSWALESCTSGSRGVRKIKQESAGEKGAVKSAKRRGRSKRRQRVGKSRFKLSRVTRKDETFSPDKVNRNGPLVVDGCDQAASIGGQFAENAVVVAAAAAQADGAMGGSGVVTIKQEPEMDEGVLQMHEIKVEKPELEGVESQEMAAGTTLVVPMGTAAALQQQQRAATRNIIFPSGANYLAQQGENTIILTSSLNSVKNHLNGPVTEKTLITAGTPPNKTVSLRRQLTPAGQTKMGEGDLIMINNGGATAGTSSGGSLATTNHKFSLTPVGPNAMTKTISIAGQPGATGNKFYIHSASLVNSQQQSQAQQQHITLTSAGGAGQGGTKALQYLTPANIKFNLMTTTGGPGTGAAGQAQDIKSILASSLPSNIIINDHAGNNIGSAAAQQQLQAGQQQQQHGQQQRTKTMNVFMDGEKRFLYTNNRGQLMAQLNSAKMVNIVPVQSSGMTAAGSAAPGSAAAQLQSQVLAGTANSNTKIITTTKSGQQAVLDGSSRIISTQQPTGGGQRGMAVQRLRAVRNSVQQQSQQVVASGGAGGGVSNNSGSEVRTFNRILIQSAPGAGTGASVSIGGSGGGGESSSGSAGAAGGSGAAASGGGGTVSSINVNAINR